MKTQKNRKEISDEFKWDLSPIFAKVEDWYNEYEDVKKEIPNISNYQGHITETKENFKEYLAFSEKLERRIYKLYYYAHLSFDVDTTNPDTQKLKGMMDDLLTTYETTSAFVKSELLNSDYEVIKEYLKDEELIKYQHNIEDIFRYKEHILKPEQELIVAKLSNVLGSPEDIYESLTDSDLKFGNITDEDGNQVEFTESNWGIFCRSANRDVRISAFNMLYDTYHNYTNTIANTFSKNVDYFTNMAQLKGFSSSLTASLFDDAINESVYENLIDTVNKHLDVNYKYYALKKKVLKLDELHLYDVYANLTGENKSNYSFQEAAALVKEALKPLGEKYLNDLNQAFTQKWIDVYNNKGKRGGAYSSGFYDTYPYVLLNYEGKFEDVSTLAHELGHSMHTYYSTHHNTYNNANYTIFVAEVASTVNELLLRMYLLKNSNDKNEKLSILNSMLELFRTTIMRQTMFAEFERDMHRAKEAGNVLTGEYLSNAYYDLNKKYFGNDVVVDDKIRYEWMRIPHFYYDFYVYKYVIGLSCACYIAKNIIDEVPGYQDKYLSFLSAGGSDYPANELKLADIDISSPDVIEAAISMFDNTIDEFNKLYEEVNHG